MRAKWSAPIRKYWKISEQMILKIVESCTFQSYSFEGFYMYAAVEVLRDAGYSLEETIDILR